VDYGFRQFFYHAPCLGSVQTVYPIDPQDRRLYVDVLPHDNRGAIIKAPVFQVAGGARHLRKGMTVLVFFIDSNPQMPVVLGHNFNIEQPSTIYADPLVDAHVNIDDYTVPHEETASYYRVRSRNSTGSNGAPDGSPAQVDFVLNSGTKINIFEYDPDEAAPANSPPNPPTRARVTLEMPSGFYVLEDEPQTGQSTVTLSHPTGTVITIDTTGKVTINSPTEILLECNDVQLGAEGGMTLAFFQELMALTTWAQTHTHSGVQSGGAVSGPPENPPPEPVGTQDTFAT
jgi:hypothetical protein